MNPRLILSDEKESTVRELRQSFNGCPGLMALLLKPNELPRLKELDALFLTLTAAERWGPRTAFYESQVLKTGPEDDMPPYIVTGIAMEVDDPRTRDPRAELKLVINAVLDAVKQHNSAGARPINSIGFWTEFLGMRRLDPAEAGQIIRSVYEDVAMSKNE